MRLASIVSAALLSLAAAAPAKPANHPTKPGSGSGPAGPINVAYVEVNNAAISNVGKYTLASGKPAFDVAIIFAANINWDSGHKKAVLFNNDKVQGVLNDAARQIKPLQARGTKVLLSVLGNHQGAGICNFADEGAAKDFASQLGDAVKKYGLDGVDFDDEYAEYGQHPGTPPVNEQSVAWLVTALRSELPDKLITFYNIGTAASQLSKVDPKVGSKLSYAWNAMYGSYSAPDIPGLAKNKVSAAAVNFESTPQDQAAEMAKKSKADGYGVFMTYALEGGDKSQYVSGITQALYGKAAKFQA